MNSSISPTTHPLCKAQALTVGLALSLLLLGTSAYAQSFRLRIPIVNSAQVVNPQPTDDDEEVVEPSEGAVVPTQSLTLPEGGRVGDSPVQLQPASSNPSAEWTYVSSNPSVVSVSPTGVLTFVGPGTAVITASQGPALDWLPGSVSRSISVAAAGPGNFAANNLIWAPGQLLVGGATAARCAEIGGGWRRPTRNELTAMFASTPTEILEANGWPSRAGGSAQMTWSSDVYAGIPGRFWRVGHSSSTPNLTSSAFTSTCVLPY